MNQANPNINAFFQDVKLFFEQQAELYGEDFSFPAVKKTVLVQPPRNLETLKQEVSQCKKCGLQTTRKNIVFGAGDPNAKLMLVGEAPGEAEDKLGAPFVGPAGDLLTNILKAVNFTRDEIYITNILKCRPPENRDPKENEIKACTAYLWEQIELIKPKIILALGVFAGHTLLGTAEPLTALRGKIHEKNGIPIMVTYHPAALLKNTAWKRPTWEDVQLLRRKYDELIPTNR
jgi:DNA polymerase